MRALTLTQPWAGLVASGKKRIENRPRHIIKAEDFGKKFAIHASRQIDETVYGQIASIAPENCDGPDMLRLDQTWTGLSRVTSAVIGVATVIGRTIDGKVYRDPNTLAIPHVIEPDQRRWFFGPIGYVLDDIEYLVDPVRCRGWQGFWRLPVDITERVFHAKKVST